MTEWCPYCNGTGQLSELPPQPSNEAVDALTLRAECARRKIKLSWDGYVPTTGAAKLLNKSAKTLRRWREELRGPPYRKVAGRSGHVDYRLTDLALWHSENSERIE